MQVGQSMVVSAEERLQAAIRIAERELATDRHRTGVCLVIPEALRLLVDAAKGNNPELVELVPADPDCFALLRTVTGIPMAMHYDRLVRAVWPSPDRRLRVFVSR